MFPDRIDTKVGTIYAEIGDHKVKLLQKESVRLAFNNKSCRKRKLRLTSWRKKIWAVWLEGNSSNIRRFSNRNAAIMWLKRYGIDLMVYRLNGKLVCVVNNFVYFFSREHGLTSSAESKRTCHFATRNN